MRGMEKNLPRSTVIVLAAYLPLLFSSTPVSSRASSLDEDFARVTPKKTLGITLQYGATLVGGDRCVIFASDAENFYRPHRLISLCVTDKNKVYPAKVFLKDFYEKFASVQAIDLKDFGAGSIDSPGAAAGIVIGLQVEEVFFSKLYIMAAKFNAKGKKQGALEILETIAAPAKRSFTRENMTTAKGKNSVGIAVAALIQDEQWNEESTKVYFMETDFNGKVIRGPAELKLPNDGALQAVRLGKPVLDGKWWRIPATSINYTDNGVSTPEIGTSGHTLMVLSAKPKGKGYKSKSNKVAGDNVAYDEYLFTGLQFLPPAQSAGAPAYPPATTLDLFYQFEQARMPTQDNPLPSGYSYFIQATKKGKPQGEPVEVKIPGWEPRLQYNQNDRAYSFELVSNVVADAGGNFVVGLNRSLNLTSSAPPGETGIGPAIIWRWEDQISWHRFSRSGDVGGSGYIQMGPEYGSFRATSRFAYLDVVNTYNYLFVTGKSAKDRGIRFVTILAKVAQDTGDPLGSEVGILKIPD